MVYGYYRSIVNIVLGLASFHFLSAAAWAEHRIDTSVIIELIGCDADRDVRLGVVDAYTANVLGSVDGITSSPLLAGSDAWDFYVVDSSDPDILSTHSAPILPGRNVLNVPLSSTCLWRFSIVGIAVGDRFRIGGPCVVQTNVDHTYPLILTGDDAPFPPLTDGASELTVKKAGVLTAFKMQGNVVSSGRIPSPVTGELKGFEDGGAIHDLAFLTSGEYELEVVWKMYAPPAAGVLQEVSRTKKHITVLPSVSISITPISPTEVKPSNLPGAGPLDGTVNIRVQISGLGSGYRAAFLAERQGGSGGHEADHHSFNGNKSKIDRWETHPKTPIGSFVLSEFSTAGGGITQTTFRTSEFGGMERVRIFMVHAGENFVVKDALGTVIPGLDAEVSLSGAPFTERRYERQRILQTVVDHPDFAGCQLGSVEIEVKVPNLKKLADKPAAGTDYRLTGGTDQHHGPTAFPSEDNNHYGTTKATKIIDEVGTAYKSAKSGATLGFNDMSLGKDGVGFGGLFDKNGDWKTPHGKHRIGRSVDIDRKHQTTGGGVAKVDRVKLEDLFTARGAWKIIEDGDPINGRLHYEIPK